MIQFLQRYIKYFDVFVNITIPTIGILFFNWNIADLFMLFFVELLFYGIFAFIKMVLTPTHSTFIKRFGNSLLFLLLYIVGFLFVLILVGNFSHGTEMPMPTENNQVFKFIMVGQTLSLLMYFITGNYKSSNYRLIMYQALKRTAIMFFLLLIMLIPFYWLSNKSINYVMGISLVVVKTFIDHIVMLRLNKVFKAAS